MLPGRYFRAQVEKKPQRCQLSSTDRYNPYEHAGPTKSETYRSREGWAWAPLKILGAKKTPVIAQQPTHENASVCRAAARVMTA